MPCSCCAVGCTNRKSKQPYLTFYRLPGRNKPEKRLKWIQAIKKEQWSEEEINNARVCSAHFISGKQLLAIYCVKEIIFPEPFNH